MRTRLALVLGAAGLAAAAAGGLALRFAVTHGAVAALVGGGAALLVLVLALVLAWIRLDRGLARPLEALTRACLTQAQSGAFGIDAPAAGSLIDDHAAAVARLAHAHAAARNGLAQAVAGTTARIEAEKARLEAILRDLTEAVIVCNDAHRILLYNQAAVRTLATPERLGLGRPLFDTVARAPVERVLARLNERVADAGPETAVPVESVNLRTVAGGIDILGRMSPVVGPEGRRAGYVITFPGNANTAGAFASRPEFYDFSLFAHGAPGDADWQARPLASLDYVVFDTETTGLHPSAADEIVAVAGIRIVNGRILGGETFDRLANPERPIPRRATRIHGITDAMVADCAPVPEVLRAFHRFAEGAVLVAHNAAFDMKFLALKEAAAGVAFDNPVLDTLLLSVFVHDDVADHTLEGIASRFGIDIIGRHTAAGDAMATAEIFLHLLDLLAARGIDTLGKATEVAERAVRLRRAQADF